MNLTFTVPDGPDRKAYTILRRELKASAALVRRLKASNALYVNSEPAFTDCRLAPGDTLTADLDACEPSSDLIPEDGPLTILCEEEGFLAVSKPAGQLIHPTHSRNEGTLCNAAQGYLKRSGSRGTIHAVNRLDRDTSGIVLLAKNSYMKALLIEALAASDACKTYLAVVCGEMPQETGVISAPIRRVSETNMRREVSPDGQASVTHYRVLGNSDGLSLLSLRLETGRTHQIRVHCAYLGCPLLGDRLYGTDASLARSEADGICSQLLHARSLCFAHPLTGETISLTAPVERADFLKILKKFRELS